MAQTLALSTCPRAGESLPGFIVRLAGVALMAPSELAGLAGLRQPGCAVASADLGPLAALAGVPAPVLSRMAYAPSGRANHHRFLGGEAHRTLIRLTPRRYCPECLAGYPFHRSDWDFSVATVCLDHARHLCDRCPACGSRLGWAHPDLGRCRCGARLGLARAGRTGLREVDANRDAFAIIRGEPLPWLHTGLGGLPRSDLLRLGLRLGASAAGWRSGHHPGTLASHGPRRMGDLLAASMDALRGWPPQRMPHRVWRGLAAPANDNRSMPRQPSARVNTSQR